MFGDSQTIVDDEFDLGIENGRRESNIGNDDDYDYALELLEDDEYRYAHSLQPSHRVCSAC